MAKKYSIERNLVLNEVKAGGNLDNVLVIDTNNEVGYVLRSEFVGGNQDLQSVLTQSGEITDGNLSIDFNIPNGNSVSVNAGSISIATPNGSTSIGGGTIGVLTTNGSAVMDAGGISFITPNNEGSMSPEGINITTPDNNSYINAGIVGVESRASDNVTIAQGSLSTSIVSSGADNYVLSELRLGYSINGSAPKSSLLLPNKNPVNTIYNLPSNTDDGKQMTLASLDDIPTGLTTTIAIFGGGEMVFTNGILTDIIPAIPGGGGDS